jgi:hypothetical protein
MKKIFFSSFVVAMAILIALNVLISSFDDVKFSDFNLRGEALSTELGCAGVATWVPNETLKPTSCPGVSNLATSLQCLPHAGVCCDPTQQTTCQ